MIKVLSYSNAQNTAGKFYHLYSVYQFKNALNIITRFFTLTCKVQLLHTIILPQRKGSLVFLTRTDCHHTNLDLIFITSTRLSSVRGRWVWTGAVSCLSSLVAGSSASGPFRPEWPTTVHCGISWEGQLHYITLQLHYITQSYFFQLCFVWYFNPNQAPCP